MALKDRCRQICGDEAQNCFVGNKRQIDCIADMVINKVSVSKAMIESALLNVPEGDSREYLDLALSSMADLSNWIKFLQVAHDLRELSAAAIEGAPERRAEARFPLPGIYRKYIGMTLYLSGASIEVELVDFSQRGMRFNCPVRLDMDSTVEGQLYTDHVIKKEVSFKLKVRHCKRAGESFSAGGRILEVSDAPSFNFFNNVFELLSLLRESRRP